MLVDCIHLAQGRGRQRAYVMGIFSLALELLDSEGGFCSTELVYIYIQPAYFCQFGDKDERRREDLLAVWKSPSFLRRLDWPCSAPSFLSNLNRRVIKPRDNFTVRTQQKVSYWLRHIFLPTSVLTEPQIKPLTPPSSSSPVHHSPFINHSTTPQIKNYRQRR